MIVDIVAAAIMGGALMFILWIGCKLVDSLVSALVEAREEIDKDRDQ